MYVCMYVKRITKPSAIHLFREYPKIISSGNSVAKIMKY